MKARTILLGLWASHNGKWEDIYKALQDKVWSPDMEKLGQELEDNKDLITILDEEYPNELKQCYKPDFVITREQLNGYTQAFKSKLVKELGLNVVIQLHRTGKLKNAEKKYQEYLIAEENFCQAI